MRAIVLEGVGQVACRADVAEPELRASSDAIVTVRAAGLCGSDLHPFVGREPAAPGVVQGHEFVGEVIAVGDDVRSLRVGQRVLAAFTTSCGSCAACRRGLTARCEAGQLFGWGPPERPSAPALHGGQAERVRVPLADGTLVAIPDTVSDETAILLADNLPTAWEAVARADTHPGAPLAVVGLGSVGLCAVAAAVASGATPVIGVDPVASRRERAAEVGADHTAHPHAASDLLHQLAPPEAGGVRSVVEAAGTAAAQRLAFELLAPGGTLSVISVQTEPAFSFTPVEAYDANLTVRAGRASVRATLATLLPRIVAGEFHVPTEACVTHLDVALERGPELYRAFAAREPGLIKAVFRP
jgi:alcohol dehydrogenase